MFTNVPRYFATKFNICLGLPAYIEALGSGEDEKHPQAGIPIKMVPVRVFQNYASTL